MYRPNQRSFNKHKSRYQERNSTGNTIPMNVMVDAPYSDHGQSRKPSHNSRVNDNHIPNEALGVSTKPDYDTDPETDYGTPMGPKKFYGIKKESKTSSRRGKENELFPSSSNNKSRLKHPNFDPTPYMSFLKVGDPDADMKGDDQSLPQDLAKLSELSLDTISDCIERRYKKDLIYTNCGDILISVNPFKDVELCSPQYFSEYTDTYLSETPHLFAVSAKAYKNVRAQNANQVILVSGESGAGKTEATKLLVRHLISIGGSEYHNLQERIIEINPLLEAFGNAKTRLNRNSSRFAKFLSLTINERGKIESARVKDYMLEKSRVVHQEERERNFHSFYAFLTGASDDTLESVFISRADKFRILDKQLSLSTSEKRYYQSIYNNQQAVFELIKLNEAEIQDVNIILSAVLHLGEIEFEDSDNDCVVITNEDVVCTVAALLQLDITEITKVLLERSAKLGTGETIILSKNKKQAEDERDATAKVLYERMFGWLVRRINDALKAEKFKNLPSIGILDICGFENLTVNSFEQLCINLMNEQLQNFMNKVVIEDERQLYLNEGVDIADVGVEGLNNDALLHMFMQKRVGVLDLIDEDTKNGLSNDERLVSKLAERYGTGGIFIPHTSKYPEFTIKHFPGKVSYNAQSFLEKNMDTLSEDMVNCLKSSQSALIQDLFSVPETFTGSISMANFNFRSSIKPGTKYERPVAEGNLSEKINIRRLGSFKNMFGKNLPSLQARDSANHSTHIKFFRNSLKELQSAMKDAYPFFVRCIIPNDKQIPGDFRRDRVKTQLQYNGVKEVARIRTYGFPFRFFKENFKLKYEKIANKLPGPDTIQNILQTVQADKSQYHIGNARIFLKEQVKKDLDDALSELNRKEEEELKRREEEEELKRREEEEELKRREKEKKQKTEVVNALPNQIEPIINYAPLSDSLETISEATTPASYVDDPLYDRPHGINSRNTTRPASEESSETDSVNETPNVENKSEDDKENAAWDIYQQREEEEERQDVHEQPILMAVKFIVYIILFVIILGAFIIEKGSFLLVVTNLTSNEKKKSSLQAFGSLVIAICVPYALGWLITVAKLCFGNFKRPSIPTWIWVFLMENLHSFGLCLLVFEILPQLNVIQSAMLLNATAIVPAILKVTMSSSDFNTENKAAFHCEPQGKARQILRTVLDVVAMLTQISVIPAVLHLNNNFKHEPWIVVKVVFSFLLISCSHWENFTDGRLFCELGDSNWFKNSILKVRYELQEGRHYPFVVIFLWKIGLTVLLGYPLLMDISYDEAFQSLSHHSGKLELKDVSAIIALTLAAFVAFYVSFGACMFQMQIISLTIPACLATPAVIGIFYLNDKYNFLEKITSLSFSIPNIYWYHFVFGAAWWCSFLIVTRHMWRPQIDRTANMARVFLTPNYCGILTVESIMLNRRRNLGKVFEDQEQNLQGEIISTQYKLKKIKKVKEENVNNPSTPMLYACATMWHETRTEMIQLLKSLYRLDRDQYIRRLANDSVPGYDPEFYNFEAHIFFDDAMEPDDNDEQIPNSWVKELVACMDVACSSVHGKPMKVYPPTKMPTPYGGQLIWEMPGENHLFVHMKDIKKIRNRKRWSQVMYMYYLLGYRHIMASKHELLEKLKEVDRQHGSHGLNINEINYLLGEESATKAQNTFILALDGDTDFSPGSIKILLDRMKDEKVGAACGRIHPIGNGPMVFYQRFEYAIGHWLQKSAEHVFGCVLCSPGCFSLFRASALMDTNVMKKYTTEPTEPGHHLQYDQGEDRWLCTLMLQQGYRIEYAAAADAWTFAPEGFFEFFNQRRRWMPSTIANILDLLGSSSFTTKRNANMSILYIFYQWMLMLMTILGPGTIIMMIAGAVKLVFKFTLVDAYLFATIPAAVFTFICFWFTSKVQLIFAAVLSVIYTFIMMIVLVGTIITATTENIFHPSVIVIVMLVGIFLIAGFCHPQEIWCLLHGVLYLLTIPSGYLLLVIYSICNLNDVSWGTREVPTKAQRLEMEKRKKEKEEQQKNKPKRGFWTKIFNRGGDQIRELTKLVKTLVPERTAGPQQQLGIVEAGDHVDNRMIELLSKIDFKMEQFLKRSGLDAFENSQLSSIVTDQLNVPQQPATFNLIINAESTAQPQPTEASVLAASKKSGKKNKPNEPIINQNKPKRDELVNPLWAEDKGLGSGSLIVGNKDELEFWEKFVSKYLRPIRPTPEEKKKITDGLRDLRNSSSFALIILNLLWMALNFMFQYTNAARFAIGYALDGKKYKIEESVLGLGFVFLLLLLLIIQMIGMLFHRMGTLQHLLAVTQIMICKAKVDNSYNKNRQRDDIIKGIQKLLKLPMVGDAGYSTNAAIPRSDAKHLGVTFAPKSSRGIIINDHGNEDLLGNLGRTLKSPILDQLQMSFAGSQNKMNTIRQRFATGNAHQRIMNNNLFSKSVRPNLPPRGHSFHHSFVSHANKLGFTQRELSDANLNVARDDKPDHLRNMGAMGRTLYQRTRIITDAERDIMWNDHDIFRERRPSISGDQM